MACLIPFAKMQKKHTNEEPDFPSEISLLKKRRRLLVTSDLPSAKRTNNNNFNKGSSSTRSLANVPTDYPPYFLTTVKLKAYVNLLKNPIIEAFHIQDACYLSSDNYLLAQVLVYFVRANINEDNYNVFNFFCALYLAHDMQEELDEYKWELLPWALGPEWQHRLKEFIKAKNHIWRDMSFYGIVSKAACKNIFELINKKFSTEEKLNCPILHRLRNEEHAFVISHTIRQSKGSSMSDDNNNLEESPAKSFAPKGPIWHQGTMSDVSLLPCQVCKRELSTDTIMKYQLLFEKAEIEANNEIPLLLSEGLDIADTSLLTSDASISLDSEEVWEPSQPILPKTSVGCTGRPKNVIPTGRLFPSLSNTGIENEVSIAPKELKVKTRGQRRILKERGSLSTMSPSSDENDTQSHNEYVKTPFPNKEKIAKQDEEDETCDPIFTQTSDEEETHDNDLHIRALNKKRFIGRRFGSKKDDAMLQSEYEHKLRRDSGRSQADLFDLLNHSVISSCI